MDQFSHWPRKTREYQNFAMDSTFWNEFRFRGDDIVIASYGKAGTTWIQQIVAQFIFDGVTDDKPIGDISQWVEFRIPTPDVKMPMIEAPMPTEAIMNGRSFMFSRADSESAALAKERPAAAMATEAMIAST